VPVGDGPRPETSCGDGMTRRRAFRWGVASCALALAITGTGAASAVAAPAATPARSAVGSVAAAAAINSGAIALSVPASGQKPAYDISVGLNPFKIKDGVLSIIGDRTPEEFKQALYNYQFTSGALTTRQSFSQTYGYFEMRAKIPAGKALWPAFWLLPTDKNKWPPELDILEVVGQQADKMVMTAHWKAGGTGAYQHSGCRVPFATATSGFHTFGALWQPDRLTWYIDRKPVQVLTTPPGYDIPMYMLVNLAIGGNMVGVADASTPLPASFDIDTISAYQIDGLTPPEAPK